jgi:putative transposase
MTKNLVRHQQTGHLHFVTFSCYQRKPFLNTAKGRDLFERSLERMRVRYEFLVFGYVVMPEHVHLLISEPKLARLDKALQALKLSVSVQSVQGRFWQKRYYDFNLFSDGKFVEKLRYMHRNPLKRELVTKTEEWAWSSYRHYQSGELETVEIESHWTIERRLRGETQV